MSFTIAIPTWKQITDVVFLVVAYYSTLVAPQFDWLVFCAAYWFGACVALRSWWRVTIPAKFTDEDINKYPYGSGYRDWQERRFWSAVMHALWPLFPLIGVSKFLVTFGNERKNP